MKLMKLKPRLLFERSTAGMPTYQDRIDENIALQRPTVILIDGKSQTGKTTWGRSICAERDPNYTLVFTIDELLEYLLKLKDSCFKGLDQTTGKKTWVVPKEILYRWILFDEPQLEFPKERWNSNRSLIITLITSGFGFLKPQMVMCLPNVMGIRETLFTNLLFRATVFSFRNRKKEIVRRAVIKKPYFNEKTRRYRWSMPVEEHTIPFIKEDTVYNNRKFDNFFDIQLPKWVVMLKKDSGIEETQNEIVFPTNKEKNEEKIILPDD